jgi:hypothetical protein
MTLLSFGFGHLWFYNRWDLKEIGFFLKHRSLTFRAALKREDPRFYRFRDPRLWFYCGVDIQ